MTYEFYDRMGESLNESVQTVWLLVTDFLPLFNNSNAGLMLGSKLTRHIFYKKKTDRRLHDAGTK